MRVGIVSGYFNPLHYGHIVYINEARSNCDRLIAIVNNDYQVELKGSKRFMSEDHRLGIVSNLKSVDEAFISIDKKKSQCESLRYLRDKHKDDCIIFFNSGDRTVANLDDDECEICLRLNIVQTILNLPKLYSSSELLK